MSKINGMRECILQARRIGAPHYTAHPSDHPIYELATERIRAAADRSGGGENVGFQTFKHKKKKKPVRRPEDVKEDFLREFEDEDGVRSDEELDEAEQDRRKGVWKGPEKQKPAEVLNVDKVIASLKKDDMVFDGGKTPAGKKSESNFFTWLEEYARLEYKRKKAEDDKAFIS